MEIRKKLLALNLALLLLCLLSVPALATRATAEIAVGGEVISGEVDASGTGWAYLAEERRLYLNSHYDGEPIYTAGSLIVSVNGGVFVAGDAGRYDGRALSVEGNLSLYVWSDTALFAGASGGKEAGGDGIYCGGILFAHIYAGAVLAAAAGGSNADSGGDGIYVGDYCQLTGAGRVELSGGSGLTGGCGLMADRISLAVDGMITGGTGDMGHGVACTTSCRFDCVDMTIAAGGGYALAIAEGTSVSYSSHVQASVDDELVILTPMEYTLIFNGRGGTCYGAGIISARNRYGTEYPLYGFPFSRNGYVLVSWRDDASEYPLTAHYIPESNHTLYANWLAADPGDVILHALGGRMSDGAQYAAYRQEELILPDSVTGNDVNDQFLAWTDILLPTYADEALMLYSGRWYRGGDAVTADHDGVTVLYSQYHQGGNFVFYDPNGAEIADDGAVLVQGSTTTASSLQVYVLDESRLTTREGYRFSGWNTEADGSGEELNPGDVFKVSGVCTLYAQWESELEVHEFEGGMLSRDRITGEITVELAETWEGTAYIALYDETGKMLVAAIGEGGTIELTDTEFAAKACGIFQIGDAHAPLGPAIRITFETPYLNQESA